VFFPLRTIDIIVHPIPFTETRILHEYGMLHIREGETERARKRLSAALDVFRRLGASKDVEHTEQSRKG
jgi:hypothetical protein